MHPASSSICNPQNALHSRGSGESNPVALTSETGPNGRMAAGDCGGGQIQTVQSRLVVRWLRLIVHASNSDTPLGYVFGYHIRGIGGVHRVVIHKVQHIVMDSISRYRIIAPVVYNRQKRPLAGGVHPIQRRLRVKSKTIRLGVFVGAFLSVLVAVVMAAQDRYTVKVPNGLAFSEFRGYEDWQVVAPSETDASNVMRVILANPVMMKAYREGIPGNGKPFPEGSKIAKIEWEPRKLTEAPFSAKTPDTVPGRLTEVEFIEKDSARFADTHGWGYAAFKYDAASDAFTPVTPADKPPQRNDAKCGAACHNLAAAKDYIFTEYPKR